MNSTMWNSLVWWNRICWESAVQFDLMCSQAKKTTKPNVFKLQKDQWDLLESRKPFQEQKFTHRLRKGWKSYKKREFGVFLGVINAKLCIKSKQKSYSSKQSANTTFITKTTSPPKKKTVQKVSFLTKTEWLTLETSNTLNALYLWLSW